MARKRIRRFVFNENERDRLRLAIANHATARAALELMMKDLDAMSIASTPPESIELAEIRERIFKMLRIRWVLPSKQDGVNYRDSLYTKEAAMELGEVLERHGHTVGKPVRVQF